MSDARAELADMAAEKLLRNRKCPLTSATVTVIPDRDDQAATVILTLVTATGQRIEAVFADNQESDA